VQLQGKGQALPLPAPSDSETYFAPDTAVVLQLHADGSPACWSSRFSVADATKNDGRQFRGDSH